VISSWGSTRKLPFAFTEYDFDLFSSALHSERAFEKIKRRMNCQDKNLELGFSYLDVFLIGYIINDHQDVLTHIQVRYFTYIVYQRKPGLKIHPGFVIGAL